LPCRTPKRRKRPQGHKGLVAAAANSEPDQRGVRHVADAQEPFRTLSSSLEPHGRLGRQTVQGLPRARHPGTTGRSASPMLFPRIPHGDIISAVPRFVNSVSGPERWGVLKFNSLSANFEP
jgi:hypothetical protein